MEKQRVLFICIHNSARSQMAEAFLRHLASDRFEVHSAGLEAGTLNPLVVKAMEEIGISMNGHYAKKALDYINHGERFDFVITVCDESNAERCPTFPGKAIRMHWSFPDPSALQGTEEEKLAAIRLIRDEIHSKTKHWCQARN
ncbi:MAG: arsenate reductase ArsC [Spirochaetae bacterium HGW-Spirochaetae-8]|nr:MAG: arsenate reductase ArsC [Spirochaetae bacterium HGW-Spirochaetae-8]